MQNYCFIICLFVLDGFVLPIACRNIKFSKQADLSGFTCPTMDKGFEYNKLNLMQCLKTCADSSSCFGVFHDEANMHCVGCNNEFLTSSSAPSLNGMKYFRRQTYMIVTEAKTWSKARLHCQTLGGHLADITTEEEEVYIEDQVFGTDHTETWIGASREEIGGIFHWEDGTPLSDHYVKWGIDEPSDNLDEKCVVLNWDWHDLYCGILARSLCEFD